ncbi:MAG: FecR domain-containing protein [Treponema sp.]|nr:FecR domain-containing protein [Treponema sp.]
MKTNIKKIITAFAMTSVLTAFTFADSAEIISVKGKVEANRNDTWVPLNVGDKVSESEMISTGFQSEAKIKYKDSIMQLGAMSRITLSRLSQEKTKDVVDVYLNTGAVRSKVNHSADKKVSYTVRNPVAVASVRGTEFISMDDGSVICFSGAVVLTPAALYEEPKTNETVTEEQEEISETADEVSEVTDVSDTAEDSVSEKADNTEIAEAPQTPDPADGPSKVTTPATDVAPDAPKGGVMVFGGQQSTITMNGSAATPFEAAVKEVTSAASAVKTQAAAESISMGQSPTVTKVTETVIETPVVPVPAPAPAPVPQPEKGSIEVELSWPKN